MLQHTHATRHPQPPLIDIDGTPVTITALNPHFPHLIQLLLSFLFLFFFFFLSSCLLQALTKQGLNPVYD